MHLKNFAYYSLRYSSIVKCICKRVITLWNVRISNWSFNSIHCTTLTDSIEQYVVYTVYIRRTSSSRSTSRSGSLSTMLKCTFKFFPKQFFSPFYISMPVPWHKILRDKFHIYTIHPLFRNNFPALVAGYKYLRKPELRAQKRTTAPLNSLI